MVLYQGDNTQAFGDSFVLITAKYIAPDGTEKPMPPLSKVAVKCGCIIKEYKNPEFPLRVNFDEKETSKMNIKNTMTLAAWDMQGRKKTANGKLEFTTNPQKV